MDNIVVLKCACGTVKGTLKIVPSSLFHAHCLCCDCQRFAKYLNNEKSILDEHGASELLQTYPAYMNISEGEDQISAVQLTHKGIYRWHTTCCNMPLANTMGASHIPFIGVSAKLMQFATEQEKLDKLGPVTMKAFGKYAIGEMPKDVHEKFPTSYIPKIIYFMLKGMLLKKSKPSPFCNGKVPAVKIKRLGNVKS